MMTPMKMSSNVPVAYVTRFRSHLNLTFAATDAHVASTQLST